MVITVSESDFGTKRTSEEQTKKIKTNDKYGL